MARVSHEFRIESGDPTAELCSRLTELSSHGWDIAGVAYGDDGLICILRREKDFDVARSLQTAFESTERIEAISRIEIPPDELETS